MASIAYLSEGIGNTVVDVENGVIRGVKILGKVSKNGREYSDEAVLQASKCYESLGVNIDHPLREGDRRDRSLRDCVGWLEKIEVKSDGVYGDLHLLKEHELSPLIFESARRAPNRFGLSHVAEGQCTSRGGKQIVESIVSVRSVDLVQSPATNTGLFESVDYGADGSTNIETEDDDVKTVSIKKLLEGSDKGKKVLTVLSEMEGDVAAMEVPAATASMSSDDQIAEAFIAAAINVLRDTSIDAKAKQAKIKEILTAQEKLMAKTSPAPAASESSDSGESSDTKTESYIPEVVARELLEAAGVPVTANKVAAMRAVDSAGRKELIESWRSAARFSMDQDEERSPLGVSRFVTKAQQRQKPVLQFREQEEKPTEGKYEPKSPQQLKAMLSAT